MVKSYNKRIDDGTLVRSSAIDWKNLIGLTLINYIFGGTLSLVAYALGISLATSIQLALVPVFFLTILSIISQLMLVIVCKSIETLEKNMEDDY